MAPPLWAPGFPEKEGLGRGRQLVAKVTQGHSPPGAATELGPHGSPRPTMLSPADSVATGETATYSNWNHRHKF